MTAARASYRRLRTLFGAIALLSAMATAGLTAPAAAQDTFLAMGTSSAGSTWFPLSGAMASVINQHAPGLRVNVEATGGNVDNVRLLGNDQIELGLISSDQAYLAYNGEGPYEGREITNFKDLLGGGQIVWQSYSLERHGIDSLADLKGKRVSLGAPGSIGNSVGADILAAYGLEMGSDWQPEYLGHGDGPAATLMFSDLTTNLIGLALLAVGIASRFALKRPSPPRQPAAASR